MQVRILFFVISIGLLATFSHAQAQFLQQLVDSTKTIIDNNIVYDPSYFSIDYPNGDIPGGKGVCTDVIIRAYRKVGIDLQKEVHEDMSENFDLYPNNWGLNRPDKNIDHRRVPNLMAFFERYGKSLPITDKPDDYLPGDIICWDLGGGITHIGLMIDRKSRDGKRYLIVHNIGQGQVAEDILFDFKIIGHYSYTK
ncbi:MAG TPA: DUF1287 domain-containing protein [Cytophagales bacterium]|mgnify:CR=1 FL=1|jgi:uncharacterized protein YijF (DUF1287 family)|nr:DUF1287 domain-containing protein [Cytophagales bacterium]